MPRWRERDDIRKFARRLPPWIKGPARRLLQYADRIFIRLGLTVRVRLQFPTGGLISGRETIFLIVHEATRTGAPILAWNLVREFQKQYNTVVLLKRGGSIQPAFEAMAAAVICLPDHFPLFPMQAFDVEAIVAKIVAVYAPKYAIANSVESRDFVAPLEARSIPVIALVHEFSSTYRPLGTLYGLFRTASHIVFSAQIVADGAVADYKILEARDFKVLPQGQSALPSILRADLNEPQLPDLEKLWPARSDEHFSVIGIGTITMRKGVDLFIAAAAAVKRMLPDQKVSFAWVGTHYSFDQPYFDLLMAQVDKSGLGPMFTFVGELENLDPIYDKADVLFLASRLDPLPNVAIDSALRGLPIVCFDQASGVAEILAKYDETRELVVPYLDHDAAAKEICNLANDPNRLGKLSVAVAEIARQRFNMENYIATLDELGRRANQSLIQMKEDLQTIVQNESFNSGLNLGFDADSMSVEAGALKYLMDSRLAAPWDKLRAGLLIRRPLEGFNPLIYAADNDKFDARGLQDPFAHFVRAGRPIGRWTHRVLTPAPNHVPRTANMKVAVHGHFHYPELLPDFIARLNKNKSRVDVFLTTTSDAKANELADIVAEFDLESVQITVETNRGRDLAPFLRALNDGFYYGYDIVGHFHGKRSPHVDGATGNRWRKFMWEHLVGGEYAMVDIILGEFAQNPQVGLVFAEDPHLNGWDENLEIAQALATRMEIAQPLPMHFDFPIGTMFWARPDALKPFQKLKLSSDDFPAEPLPIDGTVLHALERLIPFAAANAGFGYATTYVRNSKR